MPVRLRVDNPSPICAVSRRCRRRYNCVGMTATSSCLRRTAAAGDGDQLNQPGRRKLYAYAFDGNCCESGPSEPITIQGRRP